MFRRDLAEILRDRPVSVNELARELEMRPRDLLDDLQHLAKSLHHTGGRLGVEPARCRKCGFTFSTDKLQKPGKCPQCRGTWIREPRVFVEGRGEY